MSASCPKGKGRIIARILLINSALISHLYASVELVTRLRAKGHEVTSAGPKANEPMVAAAQIPFVALPDYPLGGPRLSKARGLRDRLRGQRRARLQQGVKALGVAELPGLLESLRPDLVLIDFEMHAHIMTASALGYRVALFTGICASLPGLQAPPNHTAIVPGRSIRGSRAGIAAAWLQLWLFKARRRLLENLRFGGADYPAILREHALAVGFDYRRELTTWRWQMPFSYARLPLLLFHAREFDLPAPTSEQIHYLGPMARRTRRATPEGETAFEITIAELRARRKDPAAKLVYVAFGSIKTPKPKFLVRLWEIVRNNPDWTFVFAAGSAASGVLPEDPPSNLRILKWAPQPDILRIADAAAIHAGTNTIVECIEAKVPMVCYPFDTNDQKGNGARIAFHGLGVVGDMKDPLQKIERNLHQIMTDPKIADSIARMQVVFRRYLENGVAEQVIEQLLLRPAVVP